MNSPQKNIKNLSHYSDNILVNNKLKITNPKGAEWDLATNGTMAKRENGRTDVDIVHTINIREEIHSHPNKETFNQYPSGFDFRWAKYCDEKFLNKAPAAYKVYSAKTKEYYQYFKNNQWKRV